MIVLLVLSVLIELFDLELLSSIFDTGPLFAAVGKEIRDFHD